MGVHDGSLFPWLAGEKALIKEAVASGKIVLGFCLGSQLIADVLGGKVTKNDRPEIGWHSVEWTDAARSDVRFSFFPRTTPVFQWHFDTFSELPPGARLLATSGACRHQAFVHGDRVFGFQFHLENTSEMIRHMTLDLPEGCGPSEWVQSAEEMTAHPELVEQNGRWLREMLDRIAAGT
jgi:GMP synthase-like glutamine amidotransferase